MSLTVPVKVNPSRVPDERGRFGEFGGRFVPETLIGALQQLEQSYREVCEDDGYWRELSEIMATFAGRPTPLYRAQRLADLWQVDLYLKREDLNHTGSHKLNNCLGQALLARRLGKKRIIAETGAGQHGVATATVCAHFGLECIVYMGSEDVRRQSLNVYRMELLGAQVVPVESGSKTLKDATNEAMRDWVGHADDTHYIIGSVVGPHPFPMMVRDFQSVIGREIHQQLGQDPDLVVACVGGGSNAAGAFAPFVERPGVRLVGVEAGGGGVGSGQHCCSLTEGRPGILHGARTFLLQQEGQVQATHSVSAGLDYPGVGPEHSYWMTEGRVEYDSVTDQEALEAFGLVARTEGILTALETAHAFAWCHQNLPQLDPATKVVVCNSGRGDKDVMEVKRLLREA